MAVVAGGGSKRSPASSLSGAGARATTEFEHSEHGGTDANGCVRLLGAPGARCACSGTSVTVILATAATTERRTELRAAMAAAASSTARELGERGERSGAHRGGTRRPGGSLGAAGDGEFGDELRRWQRKKKRSIRSMQTRPARSGALEEAEKRGGARRRGLRPRGCSVAAVATSAWRRCARVRGDREKRGEGRGWGLGFDSGDDGEARPYPSSGSVAGGACR